MAKKIMMKEKKDKKEKAAAQLLDVRFKKKNTLFFGIGLASVILGFILLGLGDTVIAPILLVAGYLIFFPLGILLK